MKYSSFLIILCLAAFALSSLVFYSNKHRRASSKTAQKVLRVALRTEPLTLDPRKNSDGITSLFLLFISEGLTRLTPEGKPSLALAESVHLSEDQCTYTFVLKKAQWSNGDLITADDFKTSWLQGLEPSFTAYNPEYLFVIKGAKKAYTRQSSLDEVAIEAPNSHTLIVTLEHPAPYFLELVANKIFFPVHQSAKVCCGPFLIEEWVCQDKIILKRNPLYWDHEAVRLNRIELNMINDETTQLSLFEAGELDWVGAPFSLLPADSLSELKTREQFHSFPTTSLYFYNFNTKKFPLNNIKLRKALTLAIERKELIDHVSQGNEVPALSLLPKQMHGIHKEYFQDGDVQEAQKLFKEALEELKLTEATFPALTLSYPSIQVRHIMAQAIQQQWQAALGIKVQLENKEWQVFLSDLNNRNYEIGALGRTTHHLDPIYFLSLFKTTNQATNRTGWEDPVYTHILEQSDFVQDPEERKRLLHQAEEIFMAQMPIAPIFFPTNYYLKNPQLQGVFLSDVGGVDFKWAYFE